MAEDKKSRYQNMTTSVVVAGQIRFAPKGKQGDTIEIADTKMPEGLKKLVGSCLRKV